MASTPRTPAWRDDPTGSSVKYRESESSADVTWGRARWKDAKSIVFIGQD